MVSAEIAATRSANGSAGDEGAPFGVFAIAGSPFAAFVVESSAVESSSGKRASHVLLAEWSARAEWSSLAEKKKASSASPASPEALALFALFALFFDCNSFRVETGTSSVIGATSGRAAESVGDTSLRVSFGPPFCAFSTRRSLFESSVLERRVSERDTP